MGSFGHNAGGMSLVPWNWNRVGRDMMSEKVIAIPKRDLPKWTGKDALLNLPWRIGR